MIFEAMLADDEAPARVELRHQLEDTGRVKVVEEAVSFPEAIAKLMKGRVDVAFLDWDIADPKSTLLRDALSRMDHVPMFVLMSAYKDYHPEAFGIRPLYYLPKPTDRADLDQCIEAIEKRYLELLERRAL